MQISKRIRTTFSTVEKQACVEQWRASGLKIADFAKAQGIGAGNLHRWARLSEVPAPPPTPRPVSFVPVKVISTAPSPSDGRSKGRRGWSRASRRAAGRWRFSLTVGPRY